MRRFIIAGLVILGLSSLTISAQAQFLGQLSTARTLPVGQYDLGGYFGVYEDAFTFFGQFRGGVADYFDLGLKLGLVSFDPGGEGIILGGDFKYQLLDAKQKDPLDLSLGAGLEFSSVSDFNIFSFGANFCGSYDFALSKGRVISPYARLNLRSQREHVEGGPNWLDHDFTNTDFKVGINPGVSLKVSTYFQILGELQFDDNFGFIGGVTYSFY
jgi:hypothetical protein